jgi:hypothetical protein
MQKYITLKQPRPCAQLSQEFPAQVRLQLAQVGNTWLAHHPEDNKITRTIAPEYVEKLTFVLEHGEEFDVFITPGMDRLLVDAPSGAFAQIKAIQLPDLGATRINMGDSLADSIKPCNVPEIKFKVIHP